jgi:hypothetical protein
MNWLAIASIALPLSLIASADQTPAPETPPQPAPVKAPPKPTVPAGFDKWVQAYIDGIAEEGGRK